MWIEVQTATDPVVVGVCYNKHLTSLVKDYEQFSYKLFKIFDELNFDKRGFYALGNFILDLLKTKTNNSVRMHDKFAMQMCN